MTENRDPLRLGRVRVRVPSVFGATAEQWAMPCVALAGDQVGTVLLPPQGAGVWVEFEAGNADLPIWSGCFWQEGEFPAALSTPDLRLIQTDRVKLKVEENPVPALQLTFDTGAGDAEVKIDGQGVTVSFGQASIRMTAATVSINGSALEIT